MPEPLDNLYFNWLYNKVCDSSARTPQLKFTNLLKEIHSIEFTWLIVGDDNRAEDGCDLRMEFINESGLEPSHMWLGENCSVLEMLIALARHAGFQTDSQPKEWFWIFLGNLGLSDFNNARRHNSTYIRDVVENFVWRTYDPNGQGGLFPLDNADRDQTEVELWYQLSTFLFENELA